MAIHSDGDAGSDTFHVKDVLPAFLDLSQVLPEMIDVKWLPPVPNLNVFQWVSWPFQYLSSSSALPELIIAPPTRVLPALSGKIDHEESLHRFDYWFSFLVCGPPIMAFLCETIRRVSLAIKLQFAKRKALPRDAQGYQAFRVADGDSPSSDASSSEDEECHRFQSAKCLGFAVVCYHVFCVSVVLIALASDWISIKGGGTISWELWVLWQHACLWALFIQNLLRCYYADAESLKQKGMESTISTVLLQTAPLASELADTMKDWVITGICLVAQPSKMGMAWGLFFVLADFLPRALCLPPDCLPFRVVGNVWMPLIIWQIAVISHWFARTPLLAWTYAMDIALCSLWPWREGHSVVPCLWKAFEIPFGCGLLLLNIMCAIWLTWSHEVDFLGMVMMDSGCLFIVSFYVICAAYFCVVSDKDGTREMRKTYCAILAWPTRSQPRVGAVGPKNAIERAYLWMSNKAVDFLSKARLLIAWVEDWPQGLIGLHLALGHRDQIGNFGFAAFSAMISFLKGILIPIGQWIIVAYKKHEVQMALMDSKQFARYFGEAASLKESVVVDEWKRALEKRVMDVLSDANILTAGTDLYQPIFDVRDEWMNWMKERGEPRSLNLTSEFDKWKKDHDEQPSKLPEWFVVTRASSFFALVCGEIVSQRREPKDPDPEYPDLEQPEGETLQEIMKNFSPEACQLGGFAAEDIVSKLREAGLSLKECLKAGYAVDICDAAGYTRENFVEIVSKLREAKVSLKECLKVGYKVEICVAAGYTRQNFVEIVQIRRKAKVTLEECLKAGFTVEMCVAAGYTRKNFVDIVQIRREAGVSLEDCRKAGFTVEMCVEAGYTRENP